MNMIPKGITLFLLVGILAAVIIWQSRPPQAQPSVPEITVIPEEELTIVKVFFGSLKAPEGEECTTVYPLERKIDKTSNMERKTLEELLKGPIKSEKDNGYYTSINDGVKIKKLTIDNGFAIIDFDKSLEEGVGGSCRVTSIRTQITETMKQFPSIKSVVISIDGRTEDILQP